MWNGRKEPEGFAGSKAPARDGGTIRRECSSGSEARKLLGGLSKSGRPFDYMEKQPRTKWDQELEAPCFSDQW